jgi:hypothetical protein
VDASLAVASAPMRACASLGITLDLQTDLLERLVMALDWCDSYQGHVRLLQHAQ